ncbi:MAG TPA: CBS domain-containing protein, partial [Methanothermococcus okinawensis]|nr:CBS domain-containing protein [Methanothermococcus okinawensis]
EEKIYTYMGTLLPEYSNINYSGAGQLNPLQNDYNREKKTFNTIGIGTRIFLGGGIGYVIGEGTQHDPDKAFGTLMVKGDLKTMSPKFLRAATIPNYGCTLYIGIGIPIPVLNEEVAKACAVKDEDIEVPVLDYGVPRRDRPVVARTNYEELRKGEVTIEIYDSDLKRLVEKTVKTASVSSYKKSREVAEELKKWILNGEFMLSESVAPLGKGSCKPMKAEVKLVRDILSRPPIVAKRNISIEEAARILTEKNINHLPIVDEEGRLIGIVTSWDIARAVAQNINSICEIMTKHVISSTLDEPIDVVARKMSRYDISGVPVIDKSGKVVGVVTAEDLSKLLGNRKF